MQRKGGLEVVVLGAFQRISAICVICMLLYKNFSFHWLFMRIFIGNWIKMLIVPIR